MTEVVVLTSNGVGSRPSCGHGMESINGRTDATRWSFCAVLFSLSSVTLVEG